MHSSRFAFNLSSELALPIRWPKYWSFSFCISPSNEHSGLTSFRMDWLDLLAVQGTLKSLLPHHSSKASILQHSAFFIVQLSHPFMLLLLLSCFAHVRLCVTPWMAAHQAPPFLGFSRQEHWSGNKDLEEIKKSQHIMNNAINEIKNTLEATNSRITEAKIRLVN